MEIGTNSLKRDEDDDKNAKDCNGKKKQRNEKRKRQTERKDREKGTENKTFTKSGPNMRLMKFSGGWGGTRTARQNWLHTSIQTKENYNDTPPHDK